MSIHSSVRISALCDIESSIKGNRLIVGDNSFIDSFVKIKFVGGSGDIVIGKNSYINSGTVVYSGNGISIGSDVLIAANCTLAATNHSYDSRDKLIRHQGFQDSKGGIVVESDVWIGSNSVILDGAHIGQGAIIGAGSVVRERLPGFAVYAGNPVRRIRER